MKVVLSIGSNLGNREENLSNAVAELNKIIEITHLSTVLETDPVGGPEQPDYLNAILIAECFLDPADLLKKTLEIEKNLGRTREVRWGARTIDIDLIIAGDLVIDSEFLTLPHPRAHERAFVLEPWFEIDPGAEIPGKGRVADLLAELTTEE